MSDHASAMADREHRHPGLNLDHTDPEGHASAEPVIFGFWIFLMSDLIVFALLFATYAAMSTQGTGDGPAPAQLFDLRIPLLETLVLLTSSFTLGFVSLANKYEGHPRQAIGWLVVTLVLGAGFLALEYHDFSTLIHEKHAGPQVSGFLSSYFLLTGTHFVHVAAGIAWGMVLIVQQAVLGPTLPVKLRVMRLALFWHMLDIVWIGIFTFVYLSGVLA
ncbi:cytochrome c oxidase subunit 3 [Zhengella mangrovi]|nr:cytochrome c oxidase subunit 3 [Zhengella mangrovi]